MSDLRLSLLAIGVMVLIVIFVITRRTLRKERRRNFRLGKFEREGFDDDILKDYYYEPMMPSDQRQEPVLAPAAAAEASPATQDASASAPTLPRQETGRAPPAGAAAQATPPPAAAGDARARGRQRLTVPFLRSGRRPATATDEGKPAATLPEMLVVMFLIARGHPFTGLRIDQAMQRLGLEPDHKGMYQKFMEDDAGEARPLLGVANALEPGFIDFRQLASFSTTGLVVYMRLPGPAPGVECFDHMFVLTRELADMLDAEVRDDRQSVLTVQTLGHLRERIHDFELRLQMAQGRLHPGLAPRR